jgi:hypothetical protein
MRIVVQDFLAIGIDTPRGARIRPGEYVCRRIRMLVPARGVLTLEAAPHEFHVVRAGPIQCPDDSTSRLSMGVPAGEVLVDVLLYGHLQGTFDAFTLHSSIAPN